MVDHAGGFKEVIKCVVVGDSGVGKTCLICSYACGNTYDLRQLVKTHQATVFAIDTYQRDREILERSWCDVDGCQVSFRLWDTFGHHDKNRGFAYRGSDVIVLCFSVMRPNTLRNVLKIWNVEIQRCAPNIPIILCGTQADLRYLCHDEHYINIEKGLLYRDISPCDIITPSVGREVARDIGAPYYETSVLTRYGISDVFINAARAALIDRQRMKFLNPSLRRIQKPLVQPPMKMPIPKFGQIAIAQPCIKSESDIGSVINNRSECDVTFLVQNQSIEAHRICLVVASDFFKHLFSLESLAKLQTKRKFNSHLRKQFPHRFSHTDTEHLLDDSDQESISSSSFQDSVGDSYLSGPVTRPLSHFPLSILFDHKAVENIEIRHEEDGSERLITYITLISDIAANTFRVILDFLYCGRLRPVNVEFKELLKAADLLQLSDLIVVINNTILGHHFLNREMESKFQCERIEHLRQLVRGPDFLTDITFQVDNGVVSAHKALLMVRCEMMYAMFSSDFIESASDIIPFPGITCETFKALQEFLYTGISPSLDGVDCLALIEVANRLCLPQLVNMVEQEVVTELHNYDNKDEMLRDVVTLLESAEQYNAHQLSRFCKYTLSINFRDVLQRQHKLLKSLTQDKQDEIEKRRWPPVWYLKEVEFYEKQVQSFPLSTVQSVSQEYRPKRSCLCFCSRRGKHVLKDPVELPG